MGISFAECAAQFEAIKQRAEAAAQPTAMAMGEAFKDYTANVTLRRYGTHSRFSKTPSPPGSSPAMIDGHLAASFVVIPSGGGGGIGRATVGNTAIYAAVQQFGRVIHVKDRRFLMWITDYPTRATNFPKSLRELGEGRYLNFAKSVTIPPRPYFDWEAAAAEIEKRKIETFVALVWG